MFIKSFDSLNFFEQLNIVSIVYQEFTRVIFDKDFLNNYDYSFIEEFFENNKIIKLTKKHKKAFNYIVSSINHSIINEFHKIEIDKNIGNENNYVTLLFKYISIKEKLPPLSTHSSKERLKRGISFYNDALTELFIHVYENEFNKINNLISTFPKDNKFNALFEGLAFPFQMSLAGDINALLNSLCGEYFLSPYFDYKNFKASPVLHFKDINQKSNFWNKAIFFLLPYINKESINDMLKLFKIVLEDSFENNLITLRDYFINLMDITISIPNTLDYNTYMYYTSTPSIEGVVYNKNFDDKIKKEEDE